MKIHNIRIGFANNSSSSHSIISTKRLSEIHQNQIKDGYGYGFGWEWFALKTLQSKKQYLAGLYRSSLEKLLKNKTMVTKKTAKRFQVEENEIGHIDHQSVLSFPRSRKIKKKTTTKLNEKFVDDFYDFISKDSTVILGGNDNEETENNYASYGSLFLYPFKESNSSNIVARKDGDYWTLFNKADGYRSTISFDDSLDNPSRPSSPFLIDMKITDYCDMGCKYCYQSSTVKGVHADLNSIRDNLEWIQKSVGSDMPFEIAIGGGEPTKHPNFVDIVDMINEYDMVANFTTRNLDFILNAPNEFFSKIGSFAISVDDSNVDEVVSKSKAIDDKLISMVRNNAIRMVSLGGFPAFSVQLALGTFSKNTLDKLRKNECIISNAIGTTFLGWKDFGRGTKSIKKDYSWFPNDFREMCLNDGLTIAVDTSFVHEFQILISSVSNSIFWQTAEGFNSCYIDAVKGTMSKSSYCNTVHDIHNDTFKNIWKKIESDV